jgi:hypothetical protein
MNLRVSTNSRCLTSDNLLEKTFLKTKLLKFVLQPKNYLKKYNVY